MSNINKIIKQDDSKDEIMSKEKRNFLVEKHKKLLMENIRIYKYLIIDKEMNLKLYKSLRQIEQEVGVSYSSISKKLKMSNYCICVPKKTTEVYSIQTLAE